jgi:hypothetical protein
MLYPYGHQNHVVVKGCKWSAQVNDVILYYGNIGDRSERGSEAVRRSQHRCYSGVTVVLQWRHSIGMVNMYRGSGAVRCCVLLQIIAHTEVRGLALQTRGNLWNVHVVHAFYDAFYPENHEVRSIHELVQCYYSGVQVVLLWCYSGVTVVS